MTQAERDILQRFLDNQSSASACAEAVAAISRAIISADAPLCDGELPDMECVESDGFITCYFSGQVQPI